MVRLDAIKFKRRIERDDATWHWFDEIWQEMGYCAVLSFDNTKTLVNKILGSDLRNKSWVIDQFLMSLIEGQE